MTTSDFKLRFVEAFSVILKWNHHHHGAGDHGGEFESNDDWGGDTPDFKDDSHDYSHKPKDLSAVFKQFEKDGCGLNGTPASFAKQWQSIAPTVHPHDFIKAFFGGNGLTSHNISQLKLHIDSENKRISFEATGTDLNVHGAKVLDYQRVVDLKNKVVEHSRLELAKAEQGGGVVKKLFNTCLPMYDKMGINYVQLHANLDRGGYAWSKYGFAYHDDDAREAHQNEVKTRLAKFMEPGIGVDLTPEAKKEHAAILKVLKGKKDETIWALTDMKTPHLDKLYAARIARDSDKSNFIKMVLKNTSWDGLLDIEKGTPSRERVDQFTLKVKKFENILGFRSKPL